MKVAAIEAICTLDDIRNPDPAHRAYRFGLLERANEYLLEISPESQPASYIDAQEYTEFEEVDYLEFDIPPPSGRLAEPSEDEQPPPHLTAEKAQHIQRLKKLIKDQNHGEW